MASYCLPLLGIAAILSGILLFIGVGCGKLFICRLCCKTDESEDAKPLAIPCFTKCCSSSMVIINIIINLLTFFFCVWLFYSLTKGYDDGYDDLHSHKWNILAVLFQFLWFITKIFCMYIFLTKLIGLFHTTPYAFGKCMRYTLKTIIIISFLSRFIPIIVEMIFADVNLRLIKMTRLARILFPLGYIIVMCSILCLYSHRYRLIVKRRLSMPNIQDNGYHGLDTQRIVKYALMTNLVLRITILVWIIKIVRDLFMISNGNTETTIAFVMCLDAMISTMAILFLFDFSDLLYFRFCMCNNDGFYATKCSPHNICNWFIKCCCCVPTMESRGTRINDTYIDI
eukprot:211682_1